jgi:hypothetical protein
MAAEGWFMAWDDEIAFGDSCHDQSYSPPDASLMTQLTDNTVATFHDWRKRDGDIKSHLACYGDYDTPSLDPDCFLQQIRVIMRLADLEPRDRHRHTDRVWTALLDTTPPKMMPYGLKQAWKAREVIAGLTAAQQATLDQVNAALDAAYVPAGALQRRLVDLEMAPGNQVFADARARFDGLCRGG